MGRWVGRIPGTFGNSVSRVCLVSWFSCQGLNRLTGVFVGCTLEYVCHGFVRWVKWSYTARSGV